MASIRLSGNMEILFAILGELMEEQGEEGIDILASSNGVADSIATI